MSVTPDSSGAAEKTKAALRAERLAKALRDNLKRRKLAGSEGVKSTPVRPTLLKSDGKR